ncbi:MAG: TPM domain-containing protein [Bacteroidetes bacterium]|nr:TPM domain-containing protein [Bacteroidota bacterium]MBS1649893.1 TPM domain-containing protein [Bacteroidota bacterium]
MFSFFRKKAVQYFSEEEKQIITSAIKAAERSTSGEVRVYIESKCRFVNALDRAVEVFNKLEMYKTSQQNGVLVYVAVKDRQLAIYGDKGIHEKVGDVFWNTSVNKMLSHFNTENYVDGIANVVKDIGEALQSYFPYDIKTDINELPDDVVFGK